MSSNEYHVNLHNLIGASSRLADWIYHDVRLDCDGEAVERTARRLSIVESQHGIESVYGILGAWAMKTSWRIQSAVGPQHSMMQASIGENTDASKMTTKEKAELSAIQFIVAVGNDDLEMAEAIFNAVHSGFDEDMATFVMATLAKCIQLSQEAKEIIQRRKLQQQEQT